MKSSPQGVAGLNNHQGSTSASSGAANHNNNNNANMSNDQHHFDTITMPPHMPCMVTNPNGTTRPSSACIDDSDNELSLFTNSVAAA